MEIWEILKIVCGGFFMLISSNVYGLSRVNLWSSGKKTAGGCWLLLGEISCKKDAEPKTSL